MLTPNHIGDVGSLILLTTSGVLVGWVTTAVHSFFEGLLRLLTLERTYTDVRNRGGIEALLTTLEATHFFAERRDARGNGSASMTVAGTVIGPLTRPYVAFVEVSTASEYHSRCNLRVRVLRPRWLGPLLPDSVANGIDDEASLASARKDETIRVMRQSGTMVGELEWQTRRELACPGFVLVSVRADAEAVAAHIECAARASPGHQARVMLTGAPGVGKTTSARLLAMHLGAVLVPSFDPTRPGADLQGLLCDLGLNREGYPATSSSAASGKWAVIVMEDVEGCLGRLRPAPASSAATLAVAPPMPPDADASAHGVRTEVVDKASWTGMLDTLQYTPRVVLVMTSNKPAEELDALDARAGGTLLRDGRVTDRCDFASIARSFQQPPSVQKHGQDKVKEGKRD